MEKAEKFLTKYFWIVIVLLSIPAFKALAVPGFYGASDDIHIAWLFELDKTIKLGQFPPRFVPDLSFGFGYPLFNFVFPLPFYIAEIFHLVGLSLVDSIKFLFFLTIPISGIFMYLLLRQFAGSFLSLAGAILYIYTPYRAVDLYIRGAVGEILSFTFLPLILLSVTKIIDEGFKLRWIGIGAISFASLVLSHNITAYMFFPAVFLFAILLLSVSSNKKGALIGLIFSLILALLLSGYFWIPAIWESRLMKYDTVFNFADHFPTLRQLITPYWGYGASVPGPYDGISFFLGGTNILLILLGIFSAIYYRKKFTRIEKIILIWSFISISIAVFFMNYRSSFFWQTAPLLPYFQFPWRFLIITTFCIPILIISLKYLKLQKILALGIILLCLITVSSYFRPQDFLGRGDDYYLNRYIPVPFASDEYQKTQEEYLRLPIYTQKRPSQNYPQVSFEGGEVKKLVKLNDLESLIEVESNRGGILHYNKYFFPGWKAQIDGVDANIFVGQPFGQLNVKIPEGNHTIKINFQETFTRATLNIISLITLLGVLVMIFFPKLILGLFRRADFGKIR